MIWLLEAPEQVTEEALQPLLELLSENRRRRIAGLYRAKDRVASTLAALLLRYGYAREYGGAFPAVWQMSQKKPHFTDPTAPQFNLSHCSAAVACALSRRPVGVDVQQLTPYNAKFRRILSESEQAWIAQGEPDRRFTALWTRKEAYGKALGVGIAYAMAETDFSGDWSTPQCCGEWQIRTITNAAYCLSTCAMEPLELRHVTPEMLLEFGGCK